MLRSGVRVVSILVMLLSGIQSVGAWPVADVSSRAHLQLFIHSNQAVVAVGEPYFITAEVYTWAGSEKVLQDVRAAFEAAALRVEGGGAEVIRAESIKEGRSEIDGFPYVKLARRFVVRGWTDGTIQQASITLSVDGARYEATAEPIRTFKVHSGFFHASRSILPLTALPPSPGRLGRTGTGFIVGEDAIVTSFHVAMEADRIEIRLPGGVRYTSYKAWVMDPSRDIAIIYVPPRVLRKAGLVPMNLSDESALEEVSFTMGWFNGKQVSTAGPIYQDVEFQPGEKIWVSGNHIRPGHSGGPLMDRNGTVLGVISSGTIDHGQDALREDVCIATDPRPALAMKAKMRSPRKLTAWMKDERILQDPRTFYLRVSALMNQGRRLIVRPEFEKYLDDVIAERPSDARLHYLRAQIYEIKGTAPEAENAYREALDVSSDYFPAAYSLAIHYLKQQNYEAAARLFENAREYSPYTYLASYGLAVAKMGQRQFDDAIVELRRVIQHDPTFAPGIYDLARCYLALEDEARARQLVIRLDELRSPWANALRQMLRFPVLRPVPAFEMPLADIGLL